MTRMLKPVCLFLCAAALYGETYALKPEPSTRLELRVFKTGLYRGKVHIFLFPRFAGELSYDPQKPEASRLTLSLDAAAILCTDTWLSMKDLRSVQEYAVKDMLDVAHYPQVSYTLSEVRMVSPSEFEAKGNLKIRNVEKPAVVHGKLQAKPDGTLEFQGEASVKLTDFKLKPPSAALGAIGTKDEMEFSFTLVGRAGK